jgi:F420-0:gamma-glutamyl ligase
MKITAIKTQKIIQSQVSLEDFLDQYIKKLPEKSVLVITSKVVSIIENRVKSLNENIDKLILKEADFISKKPNKYGRFTTIKHNAFISAAGIDQSNGNGSYILLPLNPHKTARKIYQYLANKFKTKQFGVVISDSRSMPLRVGAMGVAIGFWGFAPLNSYIGKQDIFGRFLKYEQANIVDALVAAAVLAMGEGNEQTPIAVVEDLVQIQFSKNRPNQKDLHEFYVSLGDDIFHLFYKNFRKID